MKTKTTLILLAVAVALSIWVKFFESKGPNTEESRRLRQNVLNIEREKLDGIVIQNGDDRIELRRTDDRWRLEAPIKDQADRSLVDNLLSTLENWQKDETITEREIENDKNALAEYDLVKPKLRLKLVGKDAPPEILFGKDAALEGKMYVRFENSKETYLVRQTVRSDITKKAEEFRDRKLTEVAASQVSRVLLPTKAGEMELQKQGDAWEIVKPLRARADAQKAGDLIAQVTSARIQQFVGDDRGDLQAYGLAEPRGSITIFKQDDKEGQTLQIGTAPEPANDQVHVRFAARGFVYTVPKKIEEVLETKPADLRDRHLVRFDSDLLDRITIDAPGKGKTVLARKDQTWSIASRNNQPANGGEVTRLINTLNSEQVTRFVEDVASDLPKYGLDQPQLVVTLSSFASENTAESAAGERPLATISFGKVDGDSVFARVGEEPFIVAVRRVFVESIFTDPLQWQDLTIFKTKPDDVQQLTIAGEREITLTRGPNKEWISSESGEAINQVNVQSLLNTLTRLRAVRWVGGAMPVQAFDKIQITLSFTTSNDANPARLIVGGAAGDGMWFARVEGRDGVFILNNPDFNALRLSVTETAAPAPPPALSPAPTPGG